MSSSTQPMKRYIYDLTQACGDLNSQLGRPIADAQADAWVVEHLHDYHYLDLGELYNRRDVRAAREFEQTCPRITDALTRSFYQLFKPMALASINAFLTEVSLKRQVLTVTLY